MRAGGVLDCFSYNGGFALKLASVAQETIAFDISEDAVARVRAERRAQRPDRSTRASATCSTNCAASTG